MAEGIQFQCLNGKRQKEKPSAESNLAACQRYSEFGCCNAKTTNYIAKEDQKMGSFSWNLCGQLSPSCHKFMRRMECFYQCSPYTWLWQHPTRKGGMQKVPVCGSFCDDWFSACKDDMTCAKDWLDDFEKEEKETKKSVRNKCPKDSKCRKFSEVFENGKAMCNQMWGDSLDYKDKDVISDECFDVDFEGRNPNWAVATKKYISSHLQKKTKMLKNFQMQATKTRKVIDQFKCVLGQLKKHEAELHTFEQAKTRDEHIFDDAKERIDGILKGDKC